MPNDDLSRLKPADPDELAFTISHALRFDGRKHHHRADAFMAGIVAEHVLKHLRDSGYVIMQKPPAPAHSAPPYKQSSGE